MGCWYIHSYMKYPCPICGVEMTEFAGEKMHPGNPAFGITLSCEHRGCTAQEVMGHGKKVEDAWAVVVEKFKIKKK